MTALIQNRRDPEERATEPASWHVLWTHSNCERSVYDHLQAKGYELFFARIEEWIANKKGKRLVQVPMFRSYLFIHHAIGKYEYLDICNTKGVVTILGESWDNLSRVPDHEINNIRNVCAGEIPVTMHPYLCSGTKVRVTRGILKNMEGLLVTNDQNTGLLVVSVSILNRSVAVEVDCTDVVAL